MNIGKGPVRKKECDVNDLLNTIAAAGPLQLILALAMLIAGPALIAIAFTMKPKPVRPVAIVQEELQEPKFADPVLSQVGFVEVEGRVLPFRSLVRQSEALDDQQLAAFQRNLEFPPTAKFAA